MRPVLLRTDCCAILSMLVCLASGGLASAQVVTPDVAAPAQADAAPGALAGTGASVPALEGTATVTGAAAPRPGAAEGTGTSPLAETAPVAAVFSAPPEDTATAIARVRDQVASLEALLAGRLPPDFDTQRLFEVDLRSPVAIQTRIAALRDAISTAPARRLALQQLLAAASRPREGTGQGLRVGTGSARPQVVTGAGLGTGEALGTGAGLGTGEARGTGEGLGTGAGLRPAPGAGRALGTGQALTGAPTVAQPELPPELVLFDLTTHRDELRLAFLTQSQQLRAAVVSAEAERQRIVVEQQAADQQATDAAQQARLAEAAQQEALAGAREAESTLQRNLLNERARIEALRGDLAHVAGELAAVRQQSATKASERLELEHHLRTQLLDPLLGTVEADDLYDTLVAELVRGRRELRLALDALKVTPAIPELVWQVDLSSPTYAGFGELRDAVQTAGDGYREQRLELVAQSEQLRWDRAEALAEAVHSLNEVRLELLPKLSRDKRELVLGLGPEGIAQLGRELEQVQLMSRWWWRQVLRDLPTWPGRLGTMLARSTPRWTALGLVVLLLGGFVAYRRRDRLWKSLRLKVFSRARESRWAAFVAPRWRATTSLASELAFLLFVVMAFALMASLTQSPPLRVLRALLIGYAWYRLAVSAVLIFLVGRLPAAVRDTVLRKRIASSVRTVGRYVYGVAVVLVVSESFLGRGYLYGLVLRFAWLGAIPIAFMLLRRWYPEIATTYNTRYPKSRLAARLRDTSPLLVRVLFAIPAAIRLVAIGTVGWFRDLAGRFERLRRAFAFLSRRRLEKQAEEVGHGTADVSVLPAELRAAFEPGPAETEHGLNYFPDMDRIEGLVKVWSEGGPGLALALIGERGAGKTSWMLELARRVHGQATTHVDVPSRFSGAAATCQWLSTVLEVPAADNVDDLVRHVETAGVRRLILLDLSQNLMLRAVGGSESFEVLVDLSARTQEQLVWICSFSRYAWLYLQSVQQSQNLFRFQVSLEDWSEEQIAELIRARMTRTGYEASFQDLLIEHVEGAALDSAIIRTSEDYLRLLWDYSNGNPRVAMHFWLRSLVSTGSNQVRVRLFEAPSVNDLEALHEQSRFLLAAVIVHENLSVAEASRVLRYTLQDCSALFAFLEAHGYIEEGADGRFRVTTHWYRAVIRFLTRKRLLFN